MVQDRDIVAMEDYSILTTVHLHINWKANMACDSKFIVKDERLLKVTGTHVHSKVVISQKQC